MLPDKHAFEGRLAQRPPGEKLAVAASGLLLALLLPPWPWAVFNLLAALGCALVWARIQPKLFLGWAAVPFGFLAGSGLGLMISVQGDFPWLVITQAGVEQAAMVSLRAAAASLWLVWLAFTTPAQQIAILMGRLPGLDLLAEVMLLVHRQLLLLAKTAFAMQAAQAARLGYRDVKSSLLSLGRLSAGLLPRALARAERMEVGLMARNLDGGPLPCLEPAKASPIFLAALGLGDLSLLLWGLS
jgi:cobalt/nickel transport system permease protein